MSDKEKIQEIVDRRRLESLKGTEEEILRYQFWCADQKQEVSSKGCQFLYASRCPLYKSCAIRDVQLVTRELQQIRVEILGR
jgi:hypothetical protein